MPSRYDDASHDGPATFVQAEETEAPTQAAPETESQPTAQAETEVTAEPQQTAAQNPAAEPEQTGLESQNPTIEPEQTSQTSAPEAPAVGSGEEELNDAMATSGISVDILNVPSGITHESSVILAADVSGTVAGIGVTEDTWGMTFQWYVGTTKMTGETGKNFTLSIPSSPAGSKSVKVVVKILSGLSRYISFLQRGENGDRQLRPRWVRRDLRCELYRRL